MEKPVLNSIENAEDWSQLDTEKMSKDVDTFLSYQMPDDSELMSQIKEACSQLGVSFDDFKKTAHNYAMFFANMEMDNSTYNEVATSLANYHCLHTKGSYHRTRNLTTMQWLKQINPDSITDCGYSVPTDYMLDKEFILDRKINLIEGSEVGEKVSKVIMDINNIPTPSMSFTVRDMNNFEYVGDSAAYVFLDSIEHTVDPDKYLKVQVNNAKDGSYFIFSIPVGKIDSFKKIHFGEWKTDDDAKKWVEENGLEILDSKLAIPNPEVDIFARPIIGGFHNILLLCRKNTSYDSSPNNYIEGAKEFFAENPEAEKPTKHMLEEIRPLLKNSDIADIGCGDASNLDFYLSNEVGHIDLIDPAKNILEIVHERMKFNPKLSKIDFTVGDFESNNLQDESMDVIISRFSMHYNTDMENAFKNIFKKLKNGGNFFAIVPHPDDSLNQTIFDKEGSDYIRINLYGNFFAEYPVHKIEEYFSNFVRDHFEVIENKTYTYTELGLNHANSNNSVLYIHLRKK